MALVVTYTAQQERILGNWKLISIRVRLSLLPRKSGIASSSQGDAREIILMADMQWKVPSLLRM